MSVSAVSFLAVSHIMKLFECTSTALTVKVKPPTVVVPNISCLVGDTVGVWVTVGIGTIVGVGVIVGIGVIVVAGAIVGVAVDVGVDVAVRGTSVTLDGTDVRVERVGRTIL